MNTSYVRHAPRGTVNVRLASIINERPGLTEYQLRKAYHRRYGVRASSQAVKAFVTKFRKDAKKKEEDTLFSRMSVKDALRLAEVSSIVGGTDRLEVMLSIIESVGGSKQAIQSLRILNSLSGLLSDGKKP